MIASPQCLAHCYSNITESLKLCSDAISSKIQCRKRNSSADKVNAYSLENITKCPWTKDDLIQSYVVALKNRGSQLSDSCTRLTMVASTAPSESNLRSIIDEVNDKVNSTFESYMSVNTKEILSMCSNS